ncbi:MAG TPA: urease accessory protein UreF [Burkholderiaceae bacterium]|nr:urease accessory protein UreF [Burkholderiaceae bacterium]
MKPTAIETGSAARLRPLIAALHLASPALPVGGFAYSQGLEKAIEDGVVIDAATAQRWIEDLLLLVVARFEAPLWLRAFDACAARDEVRLHMLNAELHAARETAELRAETRQMGASLVQLFPALGLPPWPAARGRAPITFAVAFAAACVGLQVDRETGLAAYLWAWIENQVLVAMKTVPLGQQAGQAILIALHPAVLHAVETASALGDADLGSAPVGYALASVAHETMYSRLFRS